MSKHPAALSAFTLVELAIVLVIIGLIIGGVMVGTELIRAADVRASASDIGKLTASINVFQDKYRCLPGDCVNATSYALGPNGNGDGNYLPWSGESNRAYSHMTNSGLWMATKSATAFPGFALNIKGAVSSHNGWAYLFTNDLYGGGSGDTAINGRWGNTINLVGDNGGLINKPILTGFEAQQIDGKLDDGAPTTGKIFGQSGACSSGSGYAISGNSPVCYMLVYW